MGSVSLLGLWKSGKGGRILRSEATVHGKGVRAQAWCVAVRRNSRSEKPLGSEMGKRVGTRTLIHPVTEQDKYPARVCACMCGSGFTPLSFPTVNTE